MAEKEEKKSRLAELREKMEEERATQGISFKAKSAKESVDLEKVDQIVSKMKKKYKERGLSVDEGVEARRLKELRSVIAGGPRAALSVQTVDRLKESKKSSVKMAANIYLSLKFFFDAVNKAMANFSIIKKLDYYLFSAFMPYSAAQWLAFAGVIALIVTVITFFGGFFTFLLVLKLPAATAFLFALISAVILFFFSFLIVNLVPRSRAKARGEKLNVELPFALRHMATELRAGIGLFKTLQTIAAADYGVLSEEFARTIREIDEGTDTKDALRNFSFRTQSRSMRKALSHIVRALRTGGNLSEIMNTIAEDVAFALRMKMRDFAEKMNFFGVIFIFMGIVLPVFIAILGAIANAPIGAMFAAMIPLDVMTLIMFYVIVMPLLLGLLVVYLMMSQPKV